MANKKTDKKVTPSNFIRLRDTRQALARSRFYSRVVGFLRWTLPLAVLVVLVVLVGWPILQTKSLTAIVAEAIPNLVVENLHLTGIDASNQPYSLTAARALQALKSKSLIDLEKPQGEITLNNGAWLAGKAELGRFDQQGQRLWLGGNVQLFHNEGYQFTTSEAQVDMAKNIAWGDKPILIEGSFGEIKGEGFRVLERGNVVVVTGHSRALLNLHSQPSSDKPKPSWK